MGVEFTGFSLLDVYAKSNPNKIVQKFGKEILVKVDYSKDSDGELHLSRNVEKASDFIAPDVNPEEDAQEEKLLDEQKRFQLLHS